MNDCLIQNPAYSIDPSLTFLCDLMKKIPQKYIPQKHNHGYNHEYNHLVETQLESNKIFNGEFINVKKDSVILPDNTKAIREYITHPGASVIIAIDNNRYPVAQVMLELPAGKLEINEDPLVCAKRELLEETGYSGEKWDYLGTTYPCIGYSNEKMVYYLATELSYSQPNLDVGEFLEVVTMPLQEAYKLIYNNQITDNKTITGIMLYQGYLEKNK
jgi:ADP-ribose pyrophosphatase